MILYRMVKSRSWSQTYGGLAVVIACVAAAPAAGQCVLNLSQKVTASDAWQYDYFGYSVAISGNTAVVGAYSDDHAGGEDAGAAYVYHYENSVWVEKQKLTASDGEAGDWFGFSVAIDGDLIVVGAINQDADYGGNPIDKAGAAYVFRFENDQWVEKQMLTASIATADDELGWDVAVYNAGGDGEDLVVAGVPFGVDELNHMNGYSVVYRSTDQGQNWTEEDVLGDPEGAVLDQLGFSVSVHGSVVVAGAPGWSLSPTQDDGAVYVFRYEDSV